MKNLTESQRFIVNAVEDLGDLARFSDIVRRLKLANKVLEMSQVRGMVASCVRYNLIKKDSDGFYHVVKKWRTKKRAATRKPRKQPTRRRSSIVVAAQEVASRTARQAEAAQQVADIFEQFPELRDALAKELCKRKRSRA